jgi:two-component system phosphate regulon response regulator PhoB
MTSPKTILIVEDEEDLAHLVRFNLEREGYKCLAAASGDEALRTIRKEPPDLILLDRMLPGITGDELAIKLKRGADTAAIPIIMMTAKREDTDQLVGFALGADDYVAKPFSMQVLLARINSILRRTSAKDDATAVQSAGPMRLDPARHELTIDGEIVPLTATEFKLVAALMSGRGRVMSRAQLIDKAIGEDVVVTDRTIDVHVTALRRKLGASAGWIQTVRGVGYTFRPPADTRSDKQPT